MLVKLTTVQPSFFVKWLKDLQLKTKHGALMEYHTPSSPCQIGQLEVSYLFLKNNYFFCYFPSNC